MNVDHHDNDVDHHGDDVELTGADSSGVLAYLFREREYASSRRTNVGHKGVDVDRSVSEHSNARGCLFGGRLDQRCEAPTLADQVTGVAAASRPHLD
jgi:hypothetical protein